MCRGSLLCGVLIVATSACRQPAPEPDHVVFGPRIIEVGPGAEGSREEGPGVDRAALERLASGFDDWRDRFDRWTRDHARHRAEVEEWNARFAAWVERDRDHRGDLDAASSELSRVMRLLDRWVRPLRAQESGAGHSSESPSSRARRSRS